jgi:Flp pilus assembly protein TadB
MVTLHGKRDSMNIYSKSMVIAGLIVWMSADFLHDSLVYLAAVLLIGAFLLPFIVTKATGKPFKGN